MMSGAQRSIQRRGALRVGEPERPASGGHKRQGEDAEGRASSPILPTHSPSPTLPFPPLHLDRKPPAHQPTTDHRLHRRRNPLLVLPRGHHERLFRRHARPVAGDDEPHVADGGEDGGRVAGLAGVFRGGVGGFCVCLVVLRTDEEGRRAARGGLDGGDGRVGRM